MASTFSTALATVLVVLLASGALVRFVLPRLVSALSSQINVHSISPRSFRGVRWHSSISAKGSVLDVSVTVGRVGLDFWNEWSWAKLVVEDVVVRVVRTPSLPPPPLPQSPAAATRRPSSARGDNETTTAKGASSSIQVASQLSPIRHRWETPSPSPTSDSSAQPSSIEPPRPKLPPVNADIDAVKVAGDANGASSIEKRAAILLAKLQKSVVHALRKTAERFARSVLNTLPQAAKLVDAELRGEARLLYFEKKPGEDLKTGAGPGVEVSLRGGLRIWMKVELSSAAGDASELSVAPPCDDVPQSQSGRRSATIKRATQGARAFRSSALHFGSRALGRSSGIGRLALEVPRGGGISVRQLGEPISQGSAYPESQTRTTTGRPVSVASESSLRRRTSRNSNRSTTCTPPRISSFASLSSLLFSSSRATEPEKPSESYTAPPPPPIIAAATDALLSVDGPLRATVGHRFAPGMGLLGRGSVLLQLRLLGELSVGVTAFEQLFQACKALNHDIPHGEQRERWDSISKSDKDNQKDTSLSFIDDVRVEITRIIASHVESLSDSASNRGLNLALQTNLEGFSLQAQASSPKTSPKHRHWLGSQEDSFGLSVDALLKGISVSLASWPDEDQDEAVPLDDSEDTSQLQQLVHLGPFSVDAFGSLPVFAPWRRSHACRSVPWDPNDRVIVGELTVGNVTSTVAVADCEALLSAVRARRLRLSRLRPSLPPSSVTISTPMVSPATPLPDIGLATASETENLKQPPRSSFPRLSLSAAFGDVALALRASRNNDPDALALVLVGHGGSFNASGDYRDKTVVQARFPPSTKRSRENNASAPLLQASKEGHSFAYRFETTGRSFPLSVVLKSCAQSSASAVTPEDRLLGEVGASEVLGHGWTLGWHAVSEDGASERLEFDHSSTMGELVVAVGPAKLELWQPEIASALVDFASVVQRLRNPAQAASVLDSASPPSPPSSEPAGPHRSLFSHLPAGLAASASIYSVEIVLASPDPNPDGDKNLLRGLRLGTRVFGEYAFHRRNHAEHTWLTTSRNRAYLRLPDDIGSASSAIALSGAKVDAPETAIACFTLSDLDIQPIFNAHRRGPGSEPSMSSPHRELFPPAIQREPSQHGWDFQREKSEQMNKPWTSQVEIHPFDLSDQGKARTPLLRTPLATIRVIFQDQVPSTSVQVIFKVGDIDSRLDLSHIYCALCAVQAVVALRPPPTPIPRAPRAFSSRSAKAFNIFVRATVGTAHIHVNFPLGEDLFIRLRNLRASFEPDQKSIEAESIHAFVPSLGKRFQPKGGDRSWNELARLRGIKTSIETATDGSLPIVSANFEGIRLRIPFSYHLSNLILNVSVTVKAIKHLIQMFRSGDMGLAVMPKKEGPKRVPQIFLACKTLTFEAADDEIDTKLNLIWRVGLREQVDRLDREEAFEAKVEAIRQATEVAESDDATADVGATPSRWKFSARHSVGIEDARTRLDQFNSQAWAHRHRGAVNEQAHREEETLRHLQGQHRSDPRLPILVKPPAKAPPLFRMVFSGVNLDIRPPEDLQEPERLRDFLYDFGSGLPRDTEFSLLVPLHIRWTMNSTKINLRDYPIPLFHMPPHPPSKDKTSDLPPAWEFKTQLVIAEEFPPEGSYFWIPTTIVPKHLGEEGAAAFSVNVAKTIMPVKTYACPEIKISTSAVTDFCWGTSYQPGIQDLTKVFETLTHPPRDPSERVGFWDKLRLVFHWQVKIHFSGPMHMHIKGSRSPYEVLGDGAGFVLAWSGSPRFYINQENKERELIQIEADTLVFAIPDFNDLQNQTGAKCPEQLKPDTDGDQAPPQREFRKVCAKFTNGARAGWGFKLERTCRSRDCHKCTGDRLFHRACRIFDFNPHYKVVLKTPEWLSEKGLRVEGEKSDYDAYRAFRSDYIHFSMSVVSPTVVPKDSKGKQLGHNSFHFSPKGFAHFFAWWRLFGGNMSLPIRQGPQFPASPPPSKKFGKALATIKYRFDLAPLFISHMYNNDSESDWQIGTSTYLGVKCKLAHFQADLHQREQERTVHHEHLNRTKRIPHKPFYAGDVILSDLDLRAMVAVFREPEKCLVDLDPGLFQSENVFQGKTKYLDKSWYDFDDYVETDWSPTDPHPEIELHQLAVCPRFNYQLRKGESSVPRQGKPNDSTGDGKDRPAGYGETSKFGIEPSHLCMMGQSKRPVDYEIGLAQKRKLVLEDQLHRLRDESQPVSDRTARIKDVCLKIEIIEKHISHIRHFDKGKAVSESDGEEATFDSPSKAEPDAEVLARARKISAGKGGNGQAGITKSILEKFDNLFQAHSPRLIWNNRARDVCLKYYYKSREVRGIQYHMTNQAVKYIREMTKDQPQFSFLHQHHLRPAGSGAASPRPQSPSLRKTGSSMANGLLRMFADTKDEPAVVDADAAPDPAQRSFVHQNGAKPVADPWEGLGDEHLVQRSHCLILIKPQIALRSDLDDESVIILAAMSSDMEMYSVLDKVDLDDPVNARVLRRTYGTMTELQAFSPARIDNSESGSEFVPLEILLDSGSKTEDFERIVPQTDVSLQYDKFNRLRLRTKTQGGTLSQRRESTHDEHLKHHMDLIMVNVPRFAVSATPRHFAGLYNVVTNLLLYQDPLQEKRAKRLESFIYSFDHSNLSGTAEIVRNLQERIRSLRRLRASLETEADLSPDNIALLASTRGQTRQLAEELDLIFDAIAAAQDPRDSRKSADKSALMFEAKAAEIAWHMLSPTKDLLAKLAIKGGAFHWLSKQDGSVANRLKIMDLQALNSQPDALYPEILSRLKMSTTDAPIILLKWRLLAPVGGISIIEHLDLALHPIRVQLERSVARGCMAYFFQDKEAPQKDNSKVSTREDSSASVIGNAFTPPAAKESQMASSNSSLVPRRRPRPSRSTSNLQPLSAELTKATPSRVGSSSHLPLDVSTTASGSSTPRGGLRSSKSNQSLRKVEDNSQAEEMRHRASRNRTFVFVNVLSTTLVLSYKGDKAKNFTDCTDLRFTAPALEFHNKTWSFEELIHEIKRQVLKSAWDQKGHLVSQFFNKRPKQANRSQPPPKLLGGAMSSSRLASPASHSSLRILINPATAPTTPSEGSATPGFTKLLPDKPIVHSPSSSLVDVSDVNASSESLPQSTRQATKSSVSNLFHKLKSSGRSSVGSASPTSKASSSRSSVYPYGGGSRAPSEDSLPAAGSSSEHVDLEHENARVAAKALLGASM